MASGRRILPAPACKSPWAACLGYLYVPIRFNGCLPISPMFQHLVRNLKGIKMLFCIFKMLSGLEFTWSRYHFWSRYVFVNKSSLAVEGWDRKVRKSKPTGQWINSFSKKKALGAILQWKLTGTCHILLLATRPLGFQKLFSLSFSSYFISYLNLAPKNETQCIYNFHPLTDERKGKQWDTEISR